MKLSVPSANVFVFPHSIICRFVFFSETLVREIGVLNWDSQIEDQSWTWVIRMWILNQDLFFSYYLSGALPIYSVDSSIYLFSINTNLSLSGMGSIKSIRSFSDELYFAVNYSEMTYCQTQQNVTFIYYKSYFFGNPCLLLLLFFFFIWLERGRLIGRHLWYNAIIGRHLLYFLVWH